MSKKSSKPSKAKAAKKPSRVSEPQKSDSESKVIDVQVTPVVENVVVVTPPSVASNVAPNEPDDSPLPLATTEPSVVDPVFNKDKCKPNAVTLSGTKVYVFPLGHPDCPGMVKCYIPHLEICMTLLRCDLMSMEAYDAMLKAKQAANKGSAANE
jgi:hypothetical protein